MGYVKVTVVGGLAGGEIWNTSACFNIVGIGTHVFSADMSQSAAARIDAAVDQSTLPLALKQLMSESATIEGWRVDGYDDADQPTGAGVVQATPHIVGTTSATKTPQDAVVFSLRSNHAGRSGRGRQYWPGLGAALTADFKLDSPTPTAIALAAATLWDLIGDELNAELAANSFTETVELAVRSRTDNASYRISSIQVGNVLDTQRRRRNKLTETYTTQSYPLP